MPNRSERGELKLIIQEEKPVEIRDERKDGFKCCSVIRKEQKESNYPRVEMISTRNPKRVHETRKGLVPC